MRVEKFEEAARNFQEAIDVAVILNALRSSAGSTCVSVLPTKSADVTVKALQDHVKAAIAPYKYPRSIKFIEALPKTATGKIQRFKLRD